MKLPIMKRLALEDFPSKERGTLSSLIENTNDISDNLTLALNKNITLRENIDCQIQTLTFFYRTVSPATFPFKFKRTTKNNPMICMVGSAVELPSPSYPNPGFISGPVYVSWELAGENTVQVNDITGLTVDNATPHYYQITLLLF